MTDSVGVIGYNQHFGGFTFWPDNFNWSFQLLRLIAMAPVGGGDFTEVFHAVRDVKSGDEQAWYQALSALAGRLEQEATAAAAEGHRVTANAKLLRASNYFRGSGFFYDIDDDRCLEAMEGRIRCFRAAAALSDPPIETVEIPYEGDATLPGYLLSPRTASAGPHPAAIVFGGGDAISEEMYFHIGRALVERGYVVLLVDGPGMGEALRRGIHGRHDWEVPTSASLDFLLTRPEVDPARVAVIAESLGGYYSTRAAAFEHRLGACVNWGGPYEFPLVLVTPTPDGELPNAGRPARRLVSLLGVADVDEAREELKKFTLDGVVGKIQCPTLLLVAGSETGFLRKDGEEEIEFELPAHRVFREIQHDQKKMITYPTGEPGCAHCQADSIVQAHEDIGDWLDEVFDNR